MASQPLRSVQCSPHTPHAHSPSCPCHGWAVYLGAAGHDAAGADSAGALAADPSSRGALRLAPLHCLNCCSCAGPIVSLSLAGPCAMEFRRGTEQRALFLPPRSLLVMADEARYAWHHYIPHRRSDPVDGQAVARSASRVSFTFRKACT